MKKKRFCLMLMLAMTVAVASAEACLDLTTLSLMSETTQVASDNRDVVETDTGYRCTWSLRSVNVCDDDLYPQAKRIEISGFSQMPGNGTPMIPVTSIPFNLAYDEEIECRVINSHYVELEMELAPARLPLAASEECGYTIDNVSPVISDLSDLDLVSVNDYRIYRGEKTGYVMLAPIQYDSQTKTVRIFTDITFDVVTHSSEVMYSAAEAIGSTSLEYDLLAADSGLLDRGGECSEDMLIITVPQYENVAEDYGKWKARMGYRAHVETSDSWTTASVKSYIETFLSSHPKFTTLLIIGNLNDVPAFESNVLNENRPDIGSYVNSRHFTDLYYACFDGEEDRIPDVLYGRIPANSLEEVKNVLNKIMEYDENPSLDSRFYAAPVGCGSFLTERNSTTGVESLPFVYVLEEIIGNLMAEKGYGWNRQYFSPSDCNPLKWHNGVAIPEELKRPNFAWDANYESEAQAINNKAFFCLFYFHGAKNGYANKHLKQEHTLLLNNKGFYPVFFSMGCSTGKNFTNNFAHSFLSKKDAGAVAVFANTEIGLTGYGDHMIYGMFNAIWPSRRLSGKMERPLPNSVPFYRLGQIMELGNKEMEAYNHSPYKYFDLHCREVMHCFGDASMMIRTQTPIPFKGVSVTSTMGRLDVVLNEYRTGDMVTYILPDGEIKSYRAAQTSATYSPLGMTTGVEVWLSGPNRPLTLCRSASNDNLLPDRGSNILACYITSSFSKICNVRFNLDVDSSNAELKVVSQNGDVIASQSCRYAEADDNRVYTQAINLGNISQGTYIVTLVTGGCVAHSVQVYVK